MDESLLTFSIFGEPTINISNKTIIDLFTIASKGVTYLGAPVTFYVAIRDTESVLMEIINDPEKANKDLDVSFFGDKYGNGKDEYRQMVWCLAWSIWGVSQTSKKSLNVFFKDIYRRIRLFVNYDELESHANYVSELMFMENVREKEAEPLFAREPIDEIASIVASSRADAEEHKVRINKLQKEYESKIVSENDSMEEVYCNAIDSIKNASKKSITKLAKELEDTTELFNKAKEKLDKVEKELKVLKSKEHQKKVGEQYLIQVFDRYIAKYEKSNDLQLRKEKYHELWPFVSSVKAMPEIIKERVAALEFAREDELEKERQAALSTQGDNNGIMAQVVNVNMGQPSIPTSNRDRHALSDSVSGYINRSIGDGSND